MLYGCRWHSDSSWALLGKYSVVSGTEAGQQCVFLFITLISDGRGKTCCQRLYKAVSSMLSASGFEGFRIVSHGESDAAGERVAGSSGIASARSLEL